MGHLQRISHIAGVRLPERRNTPCANKTSYIRTNRGAAVDEAASLRTGQHVLQLVKVYFKQMSKLDNFFTYREAAEWNLGSGSFGVKQKWD